MIEIIQTELHNKHLVVGKLFCLQPSQFFVNYKVTNVGCMDLLVGHICFVCRHYKSGNDTNLLIQGPQIAPTVFENQYN